MLLRIVEPADVPEFYVTGLGDFELKNGLIRLAFYADHGVAGGLAREGAIKVRLVMPREAERAMCRQVTALITDHEPWH